MIRFSQKKAKREVKAVFEDVSWLLTETDIDNASNFIKHGEYGVALELICDQLYEYGAKVPDELLRKIQQAASTMKLGDKTWKMLEKSGG